MEDDLELAAPLLRVDGAIAAVGELGIGVDLGFGLSQYVSNADAECFGLLPAAVGQRGVIWCRGRKMPLLVGSVETCAVPSSVVSLPEACKRWLRVGLLT